MHDDKRLNQQTTLRGERSLGFAEFGPSTGTPVFYFHGFPSSRLDWMLINDDDVLDDLHVRVIAPDRPGYGLSDFQPNRKLMDWPQDIISLADSLDIESFYVLGVSGGGPYAAACANGIGPRLIRTGIVCGMGPPDAPGVKDGASWSIPAMNRLLRPITLKLTAMGLGRDPDQFLDKSRESFSEPDRTLLAQPEMASIFLDGMKEAFRDGTRGAGHEASLYARSWGFELNDILAEVHLWHGGKDNNVPLSVGRYVADAIPECQAIFLEDEGHLTLPVNKLKDILVRLIN